MRIETRGARLVLASFVLAVAASVAWLVVPAYSTETASSTTEYEDAEIVNLETDSETLLEHEGRGMAVLLAVPVAVAGVPLLVRRGRAAIIARTLAAGVLCFGVVISGFSIGLFYLPAAALMLIGALRTPEVEPAPT